MIRIKKEQDRDPRILTRAFPLDEGNAFFLLPEGDVSPEGAVFSGFFLVLGQKSRYFVMCAGRSSAKIKVSEHGDRNKKLLQ